MDWGSYAQNQSVFGKQPEIAQYAPQVVWANLNDALFSESAAVQEQPEESQAPHPQVVEHPSLAGTPRKLTIGMAVYDDFDGVYFSAQAIRMYHPEVTKDTEILILDNHPSGPCQEALQGLAAWIEGCRYIPYQDWQSTAVRDLIFRKARSPYVMCIDSHVFLFPGAIKRLIEFLDEHPRCDDLLQGIMVSDNLQGVSTHFKPVWSHGMYGVWEKDERGESPDGEPFEIPMQGLGMFACRKDAWLGFNPRFRGFGGEEGYIHEKFRQAGRHTLCLPFLRWIHRFNRPQGIPYPNKWKDRIFNYHVGFSELDLDTNPIDEHFREHIGEEAFEQIEEQLVGELGNSFLFFDAIYCINLDSEKQRWATMQGYFDGLGILERVRRFSAIETPESRQIGRALSHRAVVQEAQQQGLQTVLVLEDDAVILEDALAHLKKNVDELERRDWHLFYLGRGEQGRRWAKAEDCQYLEQVDDRDLIDTHAIAYHQSVYQRILDDLPDTSPAMEEWIAENGMIGDYLVRLEKRFVAFPALAMASQSQTLSLGESGHRERLSAGIQTKDAHIPQHIPGYQLQEFDSELVLYHLEHGRVIYLSDTAVLIWRLCDGKRTLGEIIQLLQEAYPDAADSIACDVESAVEELIKISAIKWV